MGYIYIIKNTINDKVYIGQTVQPIEKRFACHKLHSRRPCIKTKLHVAMRDIGIEYFYVEELEECDNSILNKLEIEYIAKYDSYHNGYNSTIGGSGTRHDYLYDKYIDKFIEDYYKMSLYELCIKYNISENLTYSILNSVKIDKKPERYIKKSNKPIEIVKYDLEFRPLKHYKNINSALMEYGINKRNGYGRLKAACQKGNIAYGHRWQLASDLVYEDKIFRTKFDKEAYIQGKPAYQPEGKKYYIVDGALDSFMTISTRNKCVDCGKEISVTSERCSECDKKLRRLNIPDIETLRNLLSEYNYTQIGKMYNVSGNAVKKWAIRYNLLVEKKEKPSKYTLENLLKSYTTKQIAEIYNVHPGTVNWWAKNYGIIRTKYEQVLCMELGIVFDSKSAAARYMIENNLTESKNVHDLAYRIGIHMDNNRYLGFHWKSID